MEFTKALMVIAVLAVVVAAVGVAMTVTRIGEVQRWAGMASSDIGNASLQIIGVANIEFSYNRINWSDGLPDGVAQWVNLTSNATVVGTESSGRCTLNCNTGDAGTFNNVTKGLVINNIGATNVRLSLASDKDGTAFIGNGLISGYVPIFRWALNQITADDMLGREAGETGSCLTGGTPSGLQDTNFVDVALLGSPRVVCSNFTGGVSASNELEIDLNVRIPYDASTGPKVAWITATAQVL